MQLFADDARPGASDAAKAAKHASIVATDAAILATDAAIVATDARAALGGVSIFSLQPVPLFSRATRSAKDGGWTHNYVSAGAPHVPNRVRRLSQAGVQQLLLARDAALLAGDAALLARDASLPPNDASLLTNHAPRFADNGACLSEHEANSDDQAIESTDEALTAHDDDAITFSRDVEGICRACAFRMSISLPHHHAMTDERDAITAAQQVAE